MRPDPRAPMRFLSPAAMCTALVLSLGCADHTQPLALEPRTDAAMTSLNACAGPFVKGRNLGRLAAVRSVAQTIAVGDTARLSRLASELGPPSMSGAWSVENPEIARIDSDLVIPVTAGSTTVSARVGSRILCISLTTVFMGASLSTLTIDPVSSDVSDVARLRAVLQFSNGLSLPIRDGAQWTSLDPTIATVSLAGWLSPLRDGSVRVVARVGPAADTVQINVRTQFYQSIVPRRAEEFAGSIGVNIHLSYFDRVYGSEFRTIILPRLQELNVRHLRDDGTTLPNEDWMREVYGRWREVALATRAKFTIIVRPHRTATGPGTDYGNMSHVRDLRDRIGQEHIAAFEGLNEHDHSGRAAFAEEVRTSQRALYAVVKGDPSLASRFTVLGPSVGSIENAAAIGDLSAFMDEGVIHPYDGGRVPTTNLQSHINGIRAISGSDPLIATEVGYHTAMLSGNPWHWAVTELAQGKYTLRQFLELFNAGVRRSFAYELIDQGTDFADLEQNFGLLRLNGSPKPAFSGLRNLISLLGDRTSSDFTPTVLRVNITGDTTGVRRLVLEKGNGRQYLVLWQNAVSFDDVSRLDLSPPARQVTVHLPVTVGTVSVYAPLIGAEPLLTDRDTRTVVVAVPDHPIVIEIIR